MLYIKNNKMKKKLICVLLSFLIGIANLHTSYAIMTLEQKEEKGGMDYENTYADTVPQPTYVHNGEFIILGDSYSFLLATHCGYKINYVVHQGFGTEKILKELVPLIPDGKYKYCYFFIGPNDFILQTPIMEFQKNLQEIVNAIISKGAIPIMSTYLKPSNEALKLMAPGYVPCEYYSFVVRDLAYMNGFPFYDIDSYFYMFGYEDGDLIHPHNDMYKPLLEGLIRYIDFLVNPPEDLFSFTKENYDYLISTKSNLLP